MIATVINAIAVVAGSLIGFLLRKRITKRFEEVVFNAAGLVTLVLGIMMAIRTTRVLYLALSLILGGLVGTWANIEGGIVRFGDFLKRRFAKKETGTGFGVAFMDASVLFCVGAMALLGSFQAGAEGNYTLILTKSVLDGFIAVLFTAALGIGVAYSALTVLVYQGGLTLLASLLRGSDVLQTSLGQLMLSELSGSGGVLVIVIGLNLLKLKEIKTANFLPVLVFDLLFVLADPWIGRVLAL